MRSLLGRKIIIFISALSVGLFAGFTQMFAFCISPALSSLSLGIYMEFFKNSKSLFDNYVLATYAVMLISTSLWLWMWRSRYHMVDFYFVACGLLCEIQEIVLSYSGHYKINNLLRLFATTNTMLSNWQSLREEWAYFMYFHFLTTGLAFALLLAALFRATSVKQPSRMSIISNKS